MLDVNLKGSFLVAQAVARKMVADGTKGVIVNISSSQRHRARDTYDPVLAGRIVDPRACPRTDALTES